VLTAVVVSVALGCAGNDKPVPVAGVLTLDGQPVKGATVTFLPEASGGRPAHGLTLADGSFQLSTFRPNDGALPGNYKVTAQYNEPPEISGSFKNQQEAMEAVSKAPPPKKKVPRYTIPAPYGDPSKTSLRQKVPADGRITLDLRSQS
jgi:hypothetical protein